MVAQTGSPGIGRRSHFGAESWRPASRARSFIGRGCRCCGLSACGAGAVGCVELATRRPAWFKQRVAGTAQGRTIPISPRADPDAAQRRRPRNGRRRVAVDEAGRCAQGKPRAAPQRRNAAASAGEFEAARTPRSDSVAQSAKPVGL